MVRAIDDASKRLQQLGLQSRGEVDFSRFLAEFGSINDNLLAELIEQDGRIRLSRGKAVTLERYIEAIPDLLDRPDPLDAAIDVTLRSLSRSSHPDDEAIEKLIARYPQLAESIEEAAALNNALWSTTGLRRNFANRSTRDLPQEFGPPNSASESGESRYLLQRLLGSGAYGQVYLAVDRQLSDDGHPAMVAVKILETAERDAPARHALSEEATKARRIDHPNVVRVLDRGVTVCNEDYIVYEYVDGGDLGRWLRDQSGPIAIPLAVRLAARIARGVQAAHNAGLVHCDLKPGNIMLKAGAADEMSAPVPAEPKVADFGIAIRAGESLSILQDGAEDRHPIGNLAYISPEQYRMEDGSLTVPSDIYALGGILFTLLTGELPNGSTIEEIAETHHPDFGRRQPPRLRQLRPEIDGDLEAICRRAMAIKPEDRYSAAGAMADDLEAWLNHEPIYWMRPSMGRLLHLWIKRRPTWAASLLIGVLLLTGGAAVAGHYAIAARDAAALALQHRQQQEIERLRADQEQMRADHQAAINTERLRIAEQVQSRMLRQAEVSPTTTQLLSSAWVLHNFFEAAALQVTEDTPSFADVRMRVVEKKIARLAAEGRENSMELRLWQTNLLFWLIGRSQIDRAEPLMGELREAWSAMLDPSDPWFDLLAALDAALTVRKHLAITIEHIESAGGLSEDEKRGPSHAELIEAEQTLVRYEREIGMRDPGNPVHFLMLAVLQELYSPALLDQPEQYESTARRHFDISGGDRRRAQ